MNPQTIIGVIHAWAWMQICYAKRASERRPVMIESIINQVDRRRSEVEAGFKGAGARCSSKEQIERD